MKQTLGLLAVLALVSGCSSPADVDAASQEKAGFMQEETDLLAGEVMALAYSGFRDGQHPDRHGEYGETGKQLHCVLLS